MKMALLFMLLIFASNLSSQEVVDDYFSENQLRFEDYVYDSSIATVQLYRAGWQLSQPMIELRSGDKLKLSFDCLDGEQTDYAYTIIHCNANWEPSDLLPSQYIDGVLEDYITDYAYSRNTYQQYVHYNLIFPADFMALTKSGNYLLKVYLAENPEQLVITRRFMVLDSKVNISATINKASEINKAFYYQEVDFSIDQTQFRMADPYVATKVVLMKNYRWDNAVTTLKPVFVKEEELLYDHDDENVFPGGNEYRFFNIKDMRYRAETTDTMGREGNTYHAYLKPDEKRAFIVYLEKQDINGKRAIDIDERLFDAETDAQYVNVHFRLKYPQRIPGADVYVFGELSNWKFPQECKLKYNNKARMYETTLYVKQGFYNYNYVLFADGEASADETAIEGTHFETENDYTIMVYYRAPGSEYDELIAAETFNSRRN